MKFKKIGQLWDRIEIYTVCATLVLFTILQAIDLMVPNDSTQNLINPNTLSMFIAVILCQLFFFIDKRIPLNRKKSAGLHLFDNFDNALMFCLSNPDKIRELSIFAHSSDGYYSILRYHLQKMVHLENLTIAMRNPDSECFLDHLRQIDAVNYEREQIRHRLDCWKSLRKNEDWSKTGSLAFFSGMKIHHYDFDPSVNLMIVDNQYLLLQLFKPTQRGWGFTSDKITVYSREDPAGAALIDEWMDWFKKTEQERCRQVFPEQPNPV